MLVWRPQYAINIMLTKHLRRRRRKEEEEKRSSTRGIRRRRRKEEDIQLNINFRIRMSETSFNQT
jgi:hypothetical protein